MEFSDSPGGIQFTMQADLGEAVRWAAQATDDDIYERLARTVTSASGSLDPKRVIALGKAWFQEHEAAFREATCPTIRLLVGSDSDGITVIAAVVGILAVGGQALVAAGYAAALLVRKALDGYCDETA